MTTLEFDLLGLQLEASLSADEYDREARYAEIVANDLESLGSLSEARAERARAKRCRRLADKLRNKGK